MSAYLKVARGPYSYLLESVEGGERLGRYSFIGTEPYKVLQTGAGLARGRGGPTIANRRRNGSNTSYIPVDGLPKASTAGAVGYLAYDTIRYFEPRVHRRCRLTPRVVPESVFMFGETILIFDHLRHDIKVVSHAHLNGDVEKSVCKDAIQQDRRNGEPPGTQPLTATS